jgi:hypothetical protein
MEYPEALKIVQTRKPKENYLLIQLTYDTKVILPYKDGITFMSSLVNAEQLSEHYDKPSRIVHFAKESITTRVLSNQEYERHKIAALLNVSVSDVEAFEQAA